MRAADSRYPNENEKRDRSWDDIEESPGFCRIRRSLSPLFKVLWVTCKIPATLRAIWPGAWLEWINPQRSPREKYLARYLELTMNFLRRSTIYFTGQLFKEGWKKFFRKFKILISARRALALELKNDIFFFFFFFFLKIEVVSSLSSYLTNLILKMIKDNPVKEFSRVDGDLRPTF